LKDEHILMMPQDSEFNPQEEKKKTLKTPDISLKRPRNNFPQQWK